MLGRRGRRWLLGGGRGGQGPRTLAAELISMVVGLFLFLFILLLILLLEARRWGPGWGWGFLESAALEARAPPEPAAPPEPPASPCRQELALPGPPLNLESAALEARALTEPAAPPEPPASPCRQELTTRTPTLLSSLRRSLIVLELGGNPSVPSVLMPQATQN